LVSQPGVIYENARNLTSGFKDYRSGISYCPAYMSQIQEQQRFTISLSEVAADSHEQRIF